MTVINWLSWLYNLGYDQYGKTSRVIADMYRVATVTPVWMITENGLFFNISDFTSCGRGWTYENNLLIPSGRGAEERGKKLPVLSCEFTVDGQTVSMDEFLEEFKFVGEVPPLAVIMAAYTIQSKQVYPWWNATFNAFLRSGDPVSFGGGSKMFITSVSEDLSGNRLE